jgi:YaiO family outer membrane protein
MRTSEHSRAWVLTVVLLTVAVTVAAAQETAAEATSTEELFRQAQRLAWDGQREEAKALCQEILARKKNDVDTRLLLARIYAWEKDYKNARIEFGRVIDAKPGYSDARIGLIDAELWSGRTRHALVRVDQGLALDPDDPDLLDRRARCLEKLGRYDEALKAQRRAVKLDPENEDYRRRLRSLEAKALRNAIKLDYRYEDFPDDFIDPWHLAYLQYGHRFDWGSLLFRVDWAGRFGSTGVQYEVDSYPKLPRRMYLYLNFGFSSSSLFPDRRYGAELYKNFDKGWEGSIGFRRLEFDENDVMIYTGTVAKYWRNYWFSLRPNFSKSDFTRSRSLNLVTRYYYGDREEFSEVRVGYGTSEYESIPEFPVGDQSNWAFRAKYQRRVKVKWILNGRFGYGDQGIFVDNRDPFNNALLGLRPLDRDSWFVAGAVERQF